MSELPPIPESAHLPDPPPLPDPHAGPAAPGQALAELPAVVVSHRGPVSFGRGPDGERTASRGAGGLVTALSGLGEHLRDLVWVCAAASDEDRAVRGEHEGRAVRVTAGGTPELLPDEPDDGVGAGPEDGPVAMHLQLVDIPRVEHERFYGEISNPLLWFLQHGMYGLALAPDITPATHEAFQTGYVAVNQRFARAVIDEVRAHGGRALVLLQDYHFYLVAPLVREECPDVLLSHFVHIPWPGPDGWRVLPKDLREPLLHGLLGNDVVGFHTVGFARNFVLCAQELLGLPIDLEALSVQVGSRTVYARHYPISIDVASLEELARGEAVAARRETLREEVLQDDQARLIVRVDRTDPSKNIVRGFRAFGALLEDHPELVGKVSFLALLQPSRQDVPEYADYLAAIGAEVARVNAQHAGSGWQPIDLRLVEDFPLAVASYSLADVLIVNALADGMNLVVKEAAIAGREDLVLALSENTGAHTELGSFAVTLQPFDIQQQADAMYEALTMPIERRRHLHAAAAQVVRTNDVAKWLDVQLADLEKIAAARAVAG